MSLINISPKVNIVIFFDLILLLLYHKTHDNTIGKQKIYHNFQRCHQQLFFLSSLVIAMMIDIIVKASLKIPARENTIMS